MGKENQKSVFMQMYEGERKNEGSFNKGLYDLFLKADSPNREKLIKAFPEFFGSNIPGYGITANTMQEHESCMKMNVHLHLKGISLQNLEESLIHSEEMINGLSPLICEMLPKHQDNTQQDNNDQPYVFRLLLQSQKCDIEVSTSQSREASACAGDLYDRY